MTSHHESSCYKLCAHFTPPIRFFVYFISKIIIQQGTWSSIGMEIRVLHEARARSAARAARAERLRQKWTRLFCACLT